MVDRRVAVVRALRILVVESHLRLAEVEFMRRRWPHRVNPQLAAGSLRPSIARLHSVNHSLADNLDPPHLRQSRFVPQQVRRSEQIRESNSPVLDSPLS